MAAEILFPPALPHGKITEPLPGIHFVTGTMGFGGRLPMRFSRNMTIIREGETLTLVNSVRLTEPGLQALEQLGQVKHVIRLAGFHGMDDPFYKNRYDATVWSVDAGYFKGFNPDAKPYLNADERISTASDLPIDHAKVVEIKSANPKEALLHIDREGGILISGDCLQNWGKADEYFSFPARVMMKWMGFIKPYNVGPGWLKSAKPDRAEVSALADLAFEHLLPAHGSPVIGNANALYQPVLSNLS